MADLKISQLTGATTPLAGTEVLPVVQSSSTKKVAVSDLTAGRAVSGSSFAVTGSVAPANGIYLSAANTVSVATNSAEKVQVNSSGQVGIGVVPYASVGGNGDLLQIGNPLTKAGSGLTIGATATGDIQFSDADSGTGQYAGMIRYAHGTDTMAFWTASASRFTISSVGLVTCVGIYNATVGATNRDVFVDSTGVVGYVTSTRASKTNISQNVDVDWLLKLKPSSFNYRKRNEDGTYSDEIDGGTQIGLIAEETEAIKQDVCFYDDVDGKQVLRGVSYSKLIVPLLTLVQKQQAAIDDLTAKLAKLGV